MDQYAKSLRLGAVAILGALLLRLAMGGAFQPAVEWLLKPNTQAFLLYLETGRIVRFSPSLEENPNSDGESAAPLSGPDAQVFQPARPLTFTAEDLERTDLVYYCAARPELERLLTQPLSWDLTAQGPSVLILHTHATESYTKQGEDYLESSAYRTLDENYNMVSVGAALAEALEELGIGVVHDRSLHDYPSYNGSYDLSRKSMAAYLEKYPSIRLVLDLHRDASGDISNQLRTLATVEGRPSAQLMLVMGTDESGLSHPNWRENLALGLKLQARLEEIAPGITRPTVLRSQRFNQDMGPGVLLIEVGAAGNSHSEALAAVEVLARAIGDLAQGANTE